MQFFIVDFEVNVDMAKCLYCLALTIPFSEFTAGFRDFEGLGV